MSYDVRKVDLASSKSPILEFWNAHHDKRLDEKFTWIYEGNPDGKADTWLITHKESEQLVGMASVFPRAFFHQKRLFRSGVMGDFFIHPQHRSLGPALMLIRAIATFLDDSEYDFLYGFPNTKAEQVLKRAEFTKLGSLTKYTRLYDIERLLVSRTGINKLFMRLLARTGNILLKLLYHDTWHYKTWQCRSKISPTPDPQTDDIIESYAITESTGSKSGSYLLWKYSHKPDDENLFFNAYDSSNKLIGSIIYRNDQNTIEIRDAIYRDRLAAIDLFSMFFKEMKDSGKEYAHMFVLCHSGFQSVIDELQLSNATSGKNIYYRIAARSNIEKEVSKMLKATDFLLFRTDQDI